MKRLILCVLMVGGLAACSGSGEGKSDANAKVDAKTAGGDGEVKTDDAGADAKHAQQDAKGFPNECSDPGKLLQDALTNGTKVFNGVTLKTSISIDELINNHAKYEGKVVRLEGQIVEVCTDQGCFIRFRSKSGKEVSLKVTDGAYDFRRTASKGRYAVGQGVFSFTGSHGAQVKIDTNNGGAMLGSIDCPPL